MDEDERATDVAAQYVHGLFERAAEQKRAKEYAELDRRELARMDDKALADWQSRYPAGSAQSILAEHEWQRRISAEQIAATRFAAWVGIVGVAVGGILGWMLSSWHPFQ